MKQLTFPHISHKKTIQTKSAAADELRLITVPNVLTNNECRALIEFVEKNFAFETTKAPQKRGYAYRDNDRILIDSESLANTLFTSCGIMDLFKCVEGVAGLNPQIRFYRYTVGQRFGAHIDESVTVNGMKSRYTVLFYLSGGGSDTSSDLKGGELIFYKNKKKIVTSIAPVAGLLVIHEHGNNCLEHEAAQVTRGTKYVLRSDVMFHQ
jgi:predicted 2-oxoglutarate/Fe(II)-dependent dioxygenase YbiX